MCFQFKVLVIEILPLKVEPVILVDPNIFFTSGPIIDIDITKTDMVPGNCRSRAYITIMAVAGTNGRKRYAVNSGR
jgi:hypothetical protein